MQIHIDIQTQTNKPTSTEPCHSKPEKKVVVPSGRNKGVLRRTFVMMLSSEKDEIHPIRIWKIVCMNELATQIRLRDII